MAYSKNVRLESKKVVMFDVPAVVEMPESTNTFSVYKQTTPEPVRALKKVFLGPAGQNKRDGGLKSFKDLRLEELKTECSTRRPTCNGQ